MSWRRILLFTVVFVLALAATTWTLLQRSDAATDLLRRELERLLLVPATLAGTTIDVASGRVSVEDLRIGDPARPGETLLTVASMQFDIELNPLGEWLSLHSAVVDGVVVDLGPNLPDLATLVRPEAMASPASASPARFPSLELRRGTVRFRPRAGVAPLELRDVELQILPARGALHRGELTGTATLADFGAQLHLRGTADAATGEAQVSVALRDVGIDRGTLDRLQALLGVDLTGVAATGRIRELVAKYSIPPRHQAGRSPQLEVAGEIAGLAATAPELPNPIRSANVQFHLTDRDGGLATVRLQQKDAAGDLDVSAQATHATGKLGLEIRAHGTNILIDDRVLATLQTFDVGRDVVAALRPTAGRADLELFLQNPQGSGGLTELDLTLRDVAMSYHGFGDEAERATFPLPMVQARGRVRLRDDVILLEDVQAAIAAHAGGGDVRLTGRVETRQPAGEDTTLDIHAEGVTFNSHLREALVALLRDEGELYDRLAPTGKTAVDVHVRPRGVLDGGWSVVVRPAAATMLWAGFPYQLGDLNGSVVARASGVDFDLAGRHGEGTLSMRGRIPLAASAAGRQANFEAAFLLQGVRVDDDLRRAVAVLAPELDAAWRDCAPEGHFDAEVKVWRQAANEPLFHDARLLLQGVDLRLPCPPWTAKDLRGQLFVQGSGSEARIDFDALRGRLEHGTGQPAELAMLGSLVSAEAVQSDLAFVVRNLRLDDQLGRSLEDLGALGGGTWDSLRPSGVVDLVCRHERAADGEDQLRLVVQLVDVGSDAPILPKPARAMTGELLIADGELSFRDVRAELGGVLVQSRDGRVHTRPAPDGRTEITLKVAANGFPVDDGMANLFSGPLRQAVLDRALAGRADVDGLQLQFAIPPAGSTLPFETLIGGQLRLYDVAMSLGKGPEGIRIEGINGVVGLQESRVAETGGGLGGTLRGGSMRLFGQPFEAIEAGFSADAERLVLRDLNTRFHGGTVRSGRIDRPALDYLLPGTAAPDGRLGGDLMFEKVDVYSFLDTAGWTNPPYSGSASGQVTLDRLDGDRVVAATASGQLTIERGDLGVVPLFTAIYAQLPAPERPRFDRLDTSFRLADRRVEFARLDLRSNLLAANGAGTMDLDGYLDVELKLDNLLGPSADPVVMPLVSLLTQNIVRFHLFGYLRDLHAEKRWVTERSPGRRAVLPMPPFTERPALPDY